MDNVRNGRIKTTYLGIEDHGITVGMIMIEGDGWGQGFGNWDLRTQNQMAIFVEGVLDAVGVNSWEELKGKNVRIEGTHSVIEGIGHIFKDKWFYPRKAFEEIKETAEKGAPPP